MKKLLIPISALFILSNCHYAFANSCQHELVRDKVSLQWTGFKFTEKVGVNGTFDQIDYNFTKNLSLEKMIESIEFKIETASLNTNNPYRDKKLAMFIFGAIDNPGEIKGKVHSINLKSRKAMLELELNSIKKIIPFTLKVEKNTISFTGEFKFIDFNMDKSLQAIHKACESVHIGSDGISKTWGTVDLKVSALTKCL